MRYSTMLLLLAVAPAAVAEKADMPVAGLKKVATHIVVGEVKAIYQRTSVEGDWRYTRYVAEVAVKETEKGEKPGPLVYARYWRRSWRGAGKPPLTTSGHRGLPKEGETLRVYLARNARDGFTNDNTDGGYNVIGANGFERLTN